MFSELEKQQNENMQNIHSQSESRKIITYHPILEKAGVQSTKVYPEEIIQRHNSIHKDPSTKFIEIKEIINEIINIIKTISLKRLHNIRFGEELKELINKLLSDILYHEKKIIAHVKTRNIDRALTDLHTCLNRARDMITKLSHKKYLINSIFKDDIKHSFQDINMCYISLLTELSIDIKDESITSVNDQQKNINENDIETMRELLESYKLLHGHNKFKDYHRAHEGFLNLAKKGNVSAMECIAEMYIKGEGCIKDIEQAMQWYDKASNKGSITSRYHVAYLQVLEAERLSSNNPKKSELYSIAYSNFKYAAAQGHSDAQYQIGVLIERGCIGYPDPITAFEWYKSLADFDHTEAQVAVGTLYYKGYHVPKDTIMAVKYFWKAALKGNSAALNNLGICYERGEGVEQNLDKAIEFYRKASNLNNIYAMNNLGYLLLFRRRQHIENNEKKSYISFFTDILRLFTTAAVNNVMDAYYNIGLLLSEPFGYIHDPNIALKFFNLISDFHPKSAFKLGMMFLSGSGTKVDSKTGLIHLEKSGLMGYPEAYNILGKFYEDGIYCSKNIDKAIKYYKESAKLGNIFGQERFEMLKEIETIVNVPSSSINGTND